MTELDRLWRRAVSGLPARLFAGDGNAAAVRDGLGAVSFPAALALLGSGTSGTDEGATALRDAVVDRLGSRQGPRAWEALEAVSATGDTGTGDEPDLLARAVEAAADRLGTRAPISPAEARQVIALLRSGEFVGDVIGSLRAAATFVTTLPEAVVEDARHAPSALVELAEALGRDGVAGATDVARHVLEGRREGWPRFGRHTLGWLHGRASGRAAVATARTLIAPDNETTRLAIILYARAHGIPLTPAALDAVHDHVLNPDAPDLGPALELGVQQLLARHGVAGLVNRLRQLRPRS